MKEGRSVLFCFHLTHGELQAENAHGTCIRSNVFFFPDCLARCSAAREQSGRLSSSVFIIFMFISIQSAPQGLSGEKRTH